MKKGVWYEVPSVMWAYDYGGPECWKSMPLQVMEIEADPLISSAFRRFCLRTFRLEPWPLDQQGELNGFICHLVSTNEVREVKE